MAAITSLVLTDRADTPVNHTFTPDGFSSDRGTALFAKRDDTPAGDLRFNLGLKKTPTRRKTLIRLAYPIVATETINGIDIAKIVRAHYASVDFNFDIRGTEQERDDLVGMIYSSLAPSQALIHDTIVNLNHAY